MESAFTIVGVLDEFGGVLEEEDRSFASTWKFYDGDDGEGEGDGNGGYSDPPHPPISPWNFAVLTTPLATQESSLRLAAAFAGLDFVDASRAIAFHDNPAAVKSV